LQPANLLFNFQSKAGRNQWLKTCRRHNKNLLSWESVVLTYHGRELTFPANLQQERERNT
jgi:hypothetical protein